jgi:hypothetical protein
LTVQVSNVNEAPTITSAVAVNVSENSASTFYTVTAQDPEPGSILTYSLSGADASFFTIDPTLGTVRFVNAANFETPQDAGGDNTYDIVVSVSDGDKSSSQGVAITVTDINEAPTLPGWEGAGASVLENAGAGVVAGTTMTLLLPPRLEDETLQDMLPFVALQATLNGILAFGARVSSKFHSGQGTELLNFLGRAVEAAARGCLDRSLEGSLQLVEITRSHDGCRFGGGSQVWQAGIGGPDHVATGGQSLQINQPKPFDQ